MGLLKGSEVTLELHPNRLPVSGNKDDLEISVSENLICKRMPIATGAERMEAVIGDVMVDDSR